MSTASDVPNQLMKPAWALGVLFSAASYAAQRGKECMRAR